MPKMFQRGEEYADEPLSLYWALKFKGAKESGPYINCFETNVSSAIRQTPNASLWDKRSSVREYQRIQRAAEIAEHGDHEHTYFHRYRNSTIVRLSVVLVEWTPEERR